MLRRESTPASGAEQLHGITTLDLHYSFPTMEGKGKGRETSSTEMQSAREIV